MRSASGLFRSFPALALSAVIAWSSSLPARAADRRDRDNDTPIRTLLYSGATTRIYVRYMPWFGDSKHINVGYHSDDPQQIAGQVSEMMRRGIDGAIVDWYGPDHGMSSRSTELLLKESERQGFQFGISVDGGPLKECQKKGCDLTGFLLSELKYAENHFERSPSYIRFQGRPVVCFFDNDKYPVDWNRIRSSLALDPIFLFRNSGGFDNPHADGAFSWLAPETAKGNDPEGLKYLDNFYDKAQQHPNKFAMGSVYKGFDDSRASWGSGRYIPERCGKTWRDTFAEINRHYSSHHQLPALLIVTWNDYEEGTAIEPGIGCKDRD